MLITSLNVGLPREVIWHGQPVTTGIFKEPVSGKVALKTLNLEGDRQADLSVHGGKDKAVYCYQQLHYDFWRNELPGKDLPPGMFGENFTIDGLTEDSIHLGDRFAVGTAEVTVTQPRLPCYKLGLKFQSDQMVKRFLASGRSGFYLSVSQEGYVSCGDDLRLIGRDSNAVPVSEITRLYLTKKFNRSDLASLKRALQVDALPASWKSWFRERVARSSPSD